MSEARGFIPGDVLVFQVESGFAMKRILAVELVRDELLWHLAVYRDMYLDVESADLAAAIPSELQLELSHVALTGRAFESTQVSKLQNVSLSENELRGYQEWLSGTERPVEDRSIRLILGLR